MSNPTDPSGSDTLTPGEVTTARFAPPEKCNPCKLGEHQLCDKPTCRGCGCHRKPVIGWPASSEAMEAGR